MTHNADTAVRPVRVQPCHAAVLLELANAPPKEEP